MTLEGWRIGLSGELGIDSTIQSQDDTVLYVRRSYLLSSLGWRFRLFGPVRFLPKVYAGAAWFRRRTYSESPRLQAEASSTILSGVLGLGAAAQLPVGPSAMLAADLGAVWVPRAPTIELRSRDQSVVMSHRLWRVEPQLRLSLGVDW